MTATSLQTINNEVKIMALGWANGWMLPPVKR